MKKVFGKSSGNTNVREKASTTSAVLTTINSSKGLEYVATTTVSGYNWYQVKLSGGVFGYVRSDVGVVTTTQPSTSEWGYTFKTVPLKAGQFADEKTSKNQVYLHHTAGSASASNVVNGWNKDSLGRVATSVVIAGKGASNDKDGEIIQCFDPHKWASHLGLASKHFPSGIPYKNLDKNSLAIEICNWGQLTKGYYTKNGAKVKGDAEKYYNYLGGVVNKEDVCDLGFDYKGYRYFHKYTDAQIESTKKVLLSWKKVFGLDLTYNYKQMFELSNKAFKGDKGLYSHNSVRKDKWDVYPCPRLIKMLESL